MISYTKEINRHGTRCAGQVAATRDNGACVPGIAFNANIGGVRMLDGSVTDLVEAESLGLNQVKTRLFMKEIMVLFSNTLISIHHHGGRMTMERQWMGRQN